LTALADDGGSGRQYTRLTLAPDAHDAPWERAAESIRWYAEQRLGRADRAIRRAGVPQELVSQFGPLGIGLDVRFAAAMATSRPRLRVAADRLTGLHSSLDRREVVARDLFLRHAANANYLGKPGGAFVGHEGVRAVVDELSRSNRHEALWSVPNALADRLRRQDGLPIEFDWERRQEQDVSLLAPLHPAVAAAYELFRIEGTRQAVDASGAVRTVSTDLAVPRTAQPDVSYLRKTTGAGAVEADGSDVALLIVTAPGLETYCLADCLARGFDDDGLARTLAESGVEEVRHSLARGTGRWNADEYLELFSARDSRVVRSLQLADLCLKYLPRGVRRENLEGWLAVFESGVEARAREVAGAWTALRELAPSVVSYCVPDAADLAAVAPSLPTGGRAASPTLTTLVTRTGRVYARADRERAFGSAHLELADAVRKSIAVGLSAAGFPVAGFDADEVAAFVPRPTRHATPAAQERVRSEVTPLLPALAEKIRWEVREAW
jgi:hypothetical protein